MKNKLLVYLFSTVFFLLSTSGIHADKLKIIFNESTYRDKLFQSDISVSGEISYDTIEAIRSGITANMFVTFQLLRNNRLVARVRNLKGEKDGETAGYL